MKTKIIIVFVVVIVIALSVFALKKYMDSSLDDKYGMVNTSADEALIYGYSGSEGTNSPK